MSETYQARIADAHGQLPFIPQVSPLDRLGLYGFRPSTDFWFIPFSPIKVIVSAVKFVFFIPIFFVRLSTKVVSLIHLGRILCYGLSQSRLIELIYESLYCNITTP